MNSPIIIIVLVLIFALYLGLRASKGKDMDLEQWSVGGRSFGTIFAFFLMAGESYTTFTFLGGSSAAYSMGAACFYVFNAGVIYFIAYWLLPKIWRYGTENNLISQSDFYEHKYNSKPLGVLVAVVGVISIIPYICLQLKGLGIIVSEASYGKISPAVSIWVGLIAVCVYVMISGLRGSAWTSAFKDILILAVVIFLALYLPYHFYGGVKPMFQAINTAKPGYLVFPKKGLSLAWFVSTNLLWGFGIWCWPHMFPAILSSKSEKVIRKNAVINPVYNVILVLVLFIGFCAILTVPGLKESDLALFELSKMSFAPWVVGIIGAAGMLAALVPCSVLLLASSTLISKNIVKAAKPDMTDSQVGKLGRILIPVLALISAFFTFKGGTGIVYLLIMGYSFVTQLFPTLACSLFFKKNPITLQGACCGIITGVALVAYQTMTGLSLAAFPSLPQWIQDLDFGVVCLLANIIVTFVVSFATRNLKSKTVKNQVKTV